VLQRFALGSKEESAALRSKISTIEESLNSTSLILEQTNGKDRHSKYNFKAFTSKGMYMLERRLPLNSPPTQVYWRKLKQRLKEEGNETVTNCHALKMRAADGKMRLTDVADTEQLFRIIQSERHAVPFERASALLNLEL
jgi:hypothetical protein